MSVVGHQPPPFFKRGPAPLVRLVFFLTLSLALMVADLRVRYLEPVRFAVATALYPLKRAAAVPAEALGMGSSFFTTISALNKENEALRRVQVESAGILLRHAQLEQENQRLRALMEMRARQPAKGMVAEIVYGPRDPFRRRVVVDKGLQQGVVSGQAVVDERGVVGQVTRVFPFQSEVTLISDKDQSLPVQVIRNGLRTVLAGAGNGLLELRYLAANADVQQGDVLVTSGLDGVFLAGLPVAKVSRIERDNVLAFARIVCEPVAGVERHGMVLLLEPREAPPPLPEEPLAPADKGGKGRKGKR